jgi:coenzyme F420-reducing hydrogenase beta subunit
VIQRLDKRDCCGCFACYNICPQQCIKMQTDEEGFWYPVIDIDACTECGLCEQVCPILKKQAANSHETLAYACMNTDELIREQSSSGGLFTVLAERVLANHGVVFGAGFDDEFNVVHSWTDKADGPGKFRGSKYVQSRIGHTYQEAEDFLKMGRQVLFSGTPCQIAGLLSYLGKDYDNLLCTDIVCHGVPSPAVWQRYKRHMEEQYRGRSQRIAFRRKNCGWKLYSVSFSFDNDTEYSQTLNKDIYMQGFLRDLYLRPSCYACRFKTLKRLSDITLADFWGIQNVLPSFDDDKGTSLVLVNSPKGKAMFENVVTQLTWQEVDVSQAISYNSSAVKSVAMNPKRDAFFAELDKNEDICVLIEKYTRVSGVKKAYSIVLWLLGKVKRRVMG